MGLPSWQRLRVLVPGLPPGEAEVVTALPALSLAFWGNRGVTQALSDCEGARSLQQFEQQEGANTDGVPCPRPSGRLARRCHKGPGRRAPSCQASVRLRPATCPKPSCLHAGPVGGSVCRLGQRAKTSGRGRRGRPGPRGRREAWRPHASLGGVLLRNTGRRVERVNTVSSISRALHTSQNAFVTAVSLGLYYRDSL